MDEQRVGPYKLWLHSHELEEIGEGTQMKDTIRYLVPFGPIGLIANFLFVRPTLKRIFDYRREKLEEILERFTDAFLFGRFHGAEMGRFASVTLANFH